MVDALSRSVRASRGPPEVTRSNNGAEVIAKKLRAWIGAVGAKTAFIASGSPWENGSCERFNARFRDALLNGEAFSTPREAQILIERWRPPLQYGQAAQRPPIPACRIRKLCPDRPKANHALTINLDHLRVNGGTPTVRSASICERRS
ncbi:integrase core domain-containing protein [Thioclava sp. 15-R06ZXC-3]|uniref:Integrase core domain-containing protein n=1 Tax=Thioclava arctica TaxID=3238301 RepID=A0ABV3TLY6_9RHOB